MHFLQSCQYGVLLFSVLKVVQGGRTRTMVIAHSPAQRSSELTAYGDLIVKAFLNDLVAVSS